MMIGDHAGIVGTFGECTWKGRAGGIDYKGLAESLMAEHVSAGKRSELIEKFRRKEQRTFLCKLNKPDDSWPKT
jgi:hypothetical protein